MSVQVITFAWPDKHDAATAVMMVQEIEAAVKKWQQSLQLQDSVTCFEETSCFLIPGFLVSEALLFMGNYVAPSMVKSSVSTCVLKMMGHMICANAENACGILLTPAFSHGSTGNLYSEEYALLRTISVAGCNVDTPFQVAFDPRSKVDTCLQKS